MYEAFSQIMNDYLSKNRKANKILSEKTKNMGMEVSVRNIQRYRKSEVLPSFEFARVLMDALGVEITDQELRDCIELEKHKQTSLKYGGVFSDTLSIKIRDQGYETHRMLEYAREKAKRIFPLDEDPVGTYVMELIKKDLEGEMSHDL